MIYINYCEDNGLEKVKLLEFNQHLAKNEYGVSIFKASSAYGELKDKHCYRGLILKDRYKKIVNEITKRKFTCVKKVLINKYIDKNFLN